MSFGNQKYFYLLVSVLFTYLACRSEFHVSPWILCKCGMDICLFLNARSSVSNGILKKHQLSGATEWLLPCLWLNCNIFHHKLPLVIKDEINLYLKINHSLGTGVYIMLLSVRYVNQNNFSSMWISTIISHLLIITFHPSVHLRKGHLWASMQRVKKDLSNAFSIFWLVFTLWCLKYSWGGGVCGGVSFLHS